MKDDARIVCASIKGVRMKMRLALWSVIVALLLFGAAKSLAQEKSAITVKGSVLNNGVVVVDVIKGGKTYELQCNEGAPSCAKLKNGRYQMLELPTNSGMYECRDVQVFADNGTNEESDNKIGEYCLIQK